MALVSVSGFAVVAVWMIIVASHLSFRRWYLRTGHQVESLPYHAPCFPWIPYVTLVLLTISLIGVAFDSEQRSSLLFGIPFTLLCLGYYRYKHGAGVFRPSEQRAMATVSNEY